MCVLLYRETFREMDDDDNDAKLNASCAVYDFGVGVFQCLGESHIITPQVIFKFLGI